MRILLVLALVLLVVVTIFALNNPTAVTVRFLAWTYGTSLALAMIASVAVGALVVYIASLGAQQGLKARLRATETRLAELERQRTATPSQSPPSRT